jgi:hypothetical protein
MEEMVQHPTHHEQDELVRDHCREAEGLITASASRAAAMRIKENWCRRFRQECTSMLIVHAAAAYLDQIIARQWPRERADRPDNNE